MKYISLFLLCILFLFGCTEKEDVVTQPNKDGAIETVLSVKHDGNHDLLTTTHKIWVKNKLERVIVKVDTLNSLGNTSEEGEDKNGNTTMLSVPKDYEFYITVK